MRKSSPAHVLSFFVSLVIVACASSPAARRQAFFDRCRVGSAERDECDDKAADVAKDCDAGDPESCKLGCQSDRRLSNRAVACEASCRAGAAASCGIRGAMLADDADVAKRGQALDFLTRACDGGDGNSCAAKVKAQAGLSRAEKVALFVKGCEHAGPTACLLAGANELAAGKTALALEHFRRGDTAHIARLIARAYWDYRDREAGASNAAFAACLSTEPAQDAARRQASCIKGDAHVSEQFAWAKTYPGSALVHAPAATATGAAGAFDQSVIPSARGWFCYSIRGNAFNKIAGASHDYATIEACYLTQADCRRELPRVDPGLDVKNLYPSADKAPCEQTRTETPRAFCSTYALGGQRGYSCHEDPAKCEALTKRSSQCLPLPGVALAR